jgi:hypothetical protein
MSGLRRDESRGVFENVGLEAKWFYFVSEVCSRHTSVWGGIGVCEGAWLCVVVILDVDWSSLYQ